MEMVMRLLKMHLSENNYDLNPGERDCRAQSPGRREKSLFNFMLRVVLMMCATANRGEKKTGKANKLNSLVVRLQQIKRDLIRTHFHLCQENYRQLIEAGVNYQR